MKELTSARDVELKVYIEERRMDVTNKSQSSYPKLRGYHREWSNRVKFYFKPLFLTVFIVTSIIPNFDLL